MSCSRPVTAQTKPVFACDMLSNPGLRNFSFCDPSLDMKARVDDLVGQLTLQEKIGWLVSGAKGVSRLGIPNYEWWSEALHGVSDVGPGTKFGARSRVPLAFLRLFSLRRVVSTEARAMYNAGLAGLTFWSPNVNIFRDPRWGRAKKHPGRPVTQQDMDDTYQPPFKSCVVDGNVASVMCSYNQVNGKPTCGDPDLLAGVVRGEWKLNGYIVSDCDSLKVMFENQHYTKTPEETAALAVNSGLDLNCGSFLSENAEAAVNRGLLNETEIDRAISNNFATMMRLGFFDGNPSKRLYGNLGAGDVCTPENQELAREIARQGIVLLKNTEGSLPLSPTAIKSLAVIGPNANATHTMLGNYEGKPCKYTTPLQGLTVSVPTGIPAWLCRRSCGTVDLGAAKKIASTADAVVLVMGSDQSIEAESRDRVDITLPGQQQTLVSEVANVSNGPVILVIMSGGGMDVQFAKDNPKISSILWVGGKLPMTWYPQSYADNVSMADMNMRPDPARGYPRPNDVSTRVQRSFHSGWDQLLNIQSPTDQSANARLAIGRRARFVAHQQRKSIDAMEESCKNLARRSCESENVGKFSGGTLFYCFLASTGPHAPKRLLAFKVHLRPEEEGTVRFDIDVCKHLSVVDEKGKWRVALGNHTLHVGGLKHSLNVRI
ncbi:hypothetical protein DH2020_030861 [Rehmannia glutinosa]|uniref:Fibronectin type III-like domain-containing protein n=1 Tax=Rehmannia glutinosa TaxID=99300 RepID=A0ABR0VJL8_REHGL